MSDKIREDARNIRKLIREAEAVSDEVLVACARLKQAMVRARQNPDVNVDSGQRALLRLTQAESQALSLSTSLLRVHDELSKIGRETMGGDENTNIAPGAIRTPINAPVMDDPALLEPLLANIPLNRLGTPKDVAGVAAFLASSDADYITGSTVYVDGGLTWDYSEKRIRTDESGAGG